MFSKGKQYVILLLCVALKFSFPRLVGPSLSVFCILKFFSLYTEAKLRQIKVTLIELAENGYVITLRRLRECFEWDTNFWSKCGITVKRRHRLM
jgi:hypothetical protein